MASYLIGVFRLGPDGGLTRFTATNGLTSNSSRFVFEDREGILWLGTLDAALTRYRNGRFANLSEAKGLPARQINCIRGDAEGYLWLGSNRGIIRAHPRGIKAVVSGRQAGLDSVRLDYSDGLSSAEMPGEYQAAARKDSQGRLRFCTLKGLARVLGISQVIAKPLAIADLAEAIHQAFHNGEAGT
jgi:hypothetical protein